MNIQQNLQTVESHIRASEMLYGRLPHSVKLLAVSKKQSIDTIQQAIEAGQLAFGENYLQEALTKIIALANDAIEWHFIGPLQKNKLKKIASYFHWVHSVETLEHAMRLNEQRPSHLPPLNICLQVNIDNEPSKSGIHPDDTLTLAQACALLPNITLRGLMAIPEPKINRAAQRASFKKIYLLPEHLRENGLTIDTLSMGMSQDMEAAIAEGSTLVRIGTAIFGERI